MPSKKQKTANRISKIQKIKVLIQILLPATVSTIAFLIGNNTISFISGLIVSAILPILDLVLRE